MSRKTHTVMNEKFELPREYSIIDYLGSGAYGVVIAVTNNNNNNYAIKKCKDIFTSKILIKRTLREIRLLRLIKHTNIITLYSIIQPSNCNKYNNIYLLFELMDTDLASIIRSPQKLKTKHVQYFSFQLLSALQYLHDRNIIHRDIKPRNLLVNADCTLKLADFGLARFCYDEGSSEDGHAITDYVTTRWYRAPEIIAGWGRYSTAIDMWAVGCVIAELLARLPLFPGENTIKQLGLIIKLMGVPSEEFIAKSEKPLYRQYMTNSLIHAQQHFPDQFNSYYRHYIISEKLHNLLPYASASAVDLIQKLLNYNPKSRPTACECLNHSYISVMSESLTPVFTPLDINLLQDEFDFENRKLSMDQLRHEITYELWYHDANKNNLQDQKSFCNNNNNNVTTTTDSNNNNSSNPMAAEMTNSKYDSGYSSDNEMDSTTPSQSNAKSNNNNTASNNNQKETWKDVDDNNTIKYEAQPEATNSSFGIKHSTNNTASNNSISTIQDNSTPFAQLKDSQEGDLATLTKALGNMGIEKSNEKSPMSVAAQLDGNCGEKVIYNSPASNHATADPTFCDIETPNNNNNNNNDSGNDRVASSIVSVSETHPQFQQSLDNNDTKVRYKGSLPKQHNILPQQKVNLRLPPYGAPPEYCIPELRHNNAGKRPWPEVSDNRSIEERRSKKSFREKHIPEQSHSSFTTNVQHSHDASNHVRRHSFLPCLEDPDNDTISSAAPQFQTITQAINYNAAAVAAKSSWNPKPKLQMTHSEDYYDIKDESNSSAIGSSTAAYHYNDIEQQRQHRVPLRDNHQYNINANVEQQQSITSGQRPRHRSVESRASCVIN